MGCTMDGLGKLIPVVTSESVESILSTFTEAQESVKMAQTELDYCDKKTQDILHEMELCSMTYHSRAHLAIELADVRQRRRVAKDIIETLTPLLDWQAKHKSATDQLKQCLGSMRKVESKQGTRVYYKRATDDIGEFITKD